MYRSFLKRGFDFSVAVLLLLLLSPILALLTVALLIVNRARPFFLQERPGWNGEIFRLIKFRTMRDQRNAQGDLLPDCERLTGVGRVVRSLSLDELPQLVNVLKGDMSLVGPRPLLARYLPLYNARQARRHEVRPGITGWAQVNGRNTLCWEERFELDVYYVDHLSFFLDMKVLWLTAMKVAKREGISSATSDTMEPFTGSGGEARI
jgi:lipopolysaccharide/colanic/teichoic acid biosynthesis glycosyltransferase